MTASDFSRDVSPIVVRDNDTKHPLRNGEVNHTLAALSDVELKCGEHIAAEPKYSATCTDSSSALETASCQEKDRGLQDWPVVVVSFLCNGLISSMMNCYGVIYSELMKQMEAKHESNAAFRCSLVGSLATGLMFLMSALSGVMADRYGIRRTCLFGMCLISGSLLLSSFFTHNVEALYITYGVLYGTGCSLVYAPSLAVLGHYYDRRLGLVNGLVSLGSSVFTVPMPFALTYLIRQLNLAGTLQLLSALAALLVPCVLVLRSRSQPRSRQQLQQQQQLQEQLPNKAGASHTVTSSCSGLELDSCTGCSTVLSRVTDRVAQLLDLSIWRNGRYVVWAVAVPLGLFGYFVPYVHLLQYVGLQFPHQNGNWLIPCIGLTSGVGRIIFGLVADSAAVNKIFLHQISLTVIGLMTMLMVYCSHFELLYLIVVVMGIFDGCFISLLGTIAYELVGADGASQAIGFVLSMMSLPITMGPPIAGMMFDSSNSYTMAFTVAGVPPIAAAILMCFVYRLRPVSTQHLDKTEIRSPTLENVNVPVASV